MIGVVVWSCASREKAIIWCEDQANLAYLEGTAGLAQAMRWPEAGDLVELETRTKGELRHAFDLRMLSEKSCPELPELLAAADGAPSRPQHLRVVSSQPGSRETPENRAKKQKPAFAWPRSGAAC
ncbi:hypothetical protein [Paracoccus sp. PARArs4]|uniref:hypothetical protein n=1 Tax=Paracoccus sp. PARArs4 TaxID=2853442 RepID=UPI0024A6E66E|nr:hypothetical protein [Paracoccus sp. PARArs4]